MPAALIILIITISAGSGEQSRVDRSYAAGIERAAREALGAQTQILLRQVDADPSDAESTALGAEVRADVVVEVEWSRPDHLRTSLRLERMNARQWTAREVAFRAVDEPAERSRAVGLAIASMLPEFTERADTATPLAAPADGTKALVDARASVDAKPSADAKPSEGVRVQDAEQPPDAAAPSKQPSDETPLQDRRSEEPSLRHANIVSATGTAALGTGELNRSFGGAVDFRHALSRTLFWRVGGGFRLGDDTAEGLQSRVFSGASGLSWSAWSTARGHLSLGLRADALLVLGQFHRTDAATASSGPADRYKLLSGADLLVEASYFFGRNVALAAGFGVEALFGRTDVFVGGRQVASVAPAHTVLELGLRLGF